MNALDLKLLRVGIRSAVVCLCDPAADYSAEEYILTLDGERTITADRAVVTVGGLLPSREYRLRASRGEACGSELSFTTLPEFVTLNVRDFGARGDGSADDTACIQAAILCCPPDSRVLIPKGVFRFTNLFLKSNMTLELAEGAVLSAIPDKSRLPVLPGRIESYDERSEFLPASWEGDPLSCFASLITGMCAENVTICGSGVIDGSAGFDNWWNAEARRNDPGRPKMIFLNRCKNVTVRGITIRNSPSWNIHPYFSENLGFYDLHIESPANSHNTDGINPESCSDVEIAGIRFSVGDDCIALKSGKLYMGKTYRTPSRNIFIHNCLFFSGHGGVTVGSEIAAGVNGITVKSCRFVGTDRGLRIKTRRGRGRDSYLTGILFDGVKMERVPSPFVINCFYYCGPDGKSEYVASKEKLPVDGRTPRVGEIVMRNVVCTDCSTAGVYFYGLPESPIERLIMENIRISFSADAKPGRPAMMSGCEPVCRKGIFIRNAERVELKNVEIEGFSGDPEDLGGVGSVIRE